MQIFSSMLPDSFYQDWLLKILGFLGSSNGKESACNAGDLGCDPWVGKIPQRRTRQPSPVFLPGAFNGQRSLAGYSPWGCRVRHHWLTHSYFTFRWASISVLVMCSANIGGRRGWQAAKTVYIPIMKLNTSFLINSFIIQLLCLFICVCVIFIHFDKDSFCFD